MTNVKARLKTFSKKYLSHQILQSLAVSLTISICIPIFLLVLKTQDKGKMILPSFTIYDSSEKMSVEEIWNEFQKGKAKENISHKLDLGFFKGNCFVILKELNSVTDEVIDLGPETIDSATLFMQNKNGKWIECDKSGRMINQNEKEIRSWQCSLKIPDSGINTGGGYVLKIKNTDFTSLTLRSYSFADYSSRLLAFSSLHTLLLFLMPFTVIALFISGIRLQNIQMIFLSLMNFSLMIYAISMSGIGSAYFWNSICSKPFMSRCGYTFSALGFCFLEIFYLSFFQLKKTFSSITILILFAFSLIFSVLILVLSDAHILMIITICVLIFGLIFITIVNMSEFVKNSEPILF